MRVSRAFVICAFPIVRSLLKQKKRPGPDIRAGTLRAPTTRPKEIPEDQAQHGQQQHCDNPNQLLLVRNSALENIDNCPDISDQYQEPKDAAISEVHHFDSFSV